MYVKVKEKGIGYEEVIEKYKLVQLKNINQNFRHNEEIEVYYKVDNGNSIESSPSYKSIKNYTFEDGYCINLLQQLTY